MDIFLAVFQNVWIRTVSPLTLSTIIVAPKEFSVSLTNYSPYNLALVREEWTGSSNLVSFNFVWYQHFGETHLLAWPWVWAKHCSFMFLHLERGIQEHMAWDEKIIIIIKKINKESTHSRSPSFSGRKGRNTRGVRNPLAMQFLKLWQSLRICSG